LYFLYVLHWFRTFLLICKYTEQCKGLADEFFSPAVHFTMLGHSQRSMCITNDSLVCAWLATKCKNSRPLMSAIMPTNMKVILSCWWDTVNLPLSIKCIHAQNVDYWKLTFDKFDWMCDATVQRGQCCTNYVLKNAVLKRICELCLSWFILSLWNSCAVHETLCSESTGICHLMTVAVFVSVVTAFKCYLKTYNSLTSLPFIYES
jgi:hypothetical protein